MKRLMGLALLLAAPAAFAHPGHAVPGLGAGLLHPLLGIDHLLALVGAGLWAAQLGGAARRWVPAGFLAALAAGLAMGAGGVALPGVEPGIAASVLVFGVLVAGGARLPARVGVALSSAFALFHGYAHGVELPAGGEIAAYIAGLVMSSALTLCAAMACGAWARSAGKPAWVRVAGAGMAASGVALLAGL